MIRIIVEQMDPVHVIHANAPRPEMTLKSFDVSLPELEAYLREPSDSTRNIYFTRRVVGIELIANEG